MPKNEVALQHVLQENPTLNQEKLKSVVDRYHRERGHKVFHERISFSVMNAGIDDLFESELYRSALARYIGQNRKRVRESCLITRVNANEAEVTIGNKKVCFRALRKMGTLTNKNLDERWHTPNTRFTLEEMQGAKTAARIAINASRRKKYKNFSL